MSVFRTVCANAVRARACRTHLRMGTVFPAAVRVTPRLSTTARTSVFQPRKFYSTDNAEAATLDFDGVQTLIKGSDKGYCLVDVREPSELAQGSIPTSRNVPLSQFLYAWSLEPKEFKEEFGFEKPSDNTKLIVYCQAGVRSKSAADYLRDIGYRSVLNYSGSWVDYTERSRQQGSR